MSHDGAVMRPFAGSQYRFRLAIQHWQKLEADLGVGPRQILERVHGDQWSASDVQKVVLWGLVGGGMQTNVAADMIRDFLDPMQMFRAWELAVGILSAGWFGTDEEIRPKKDPGPEETNLNGSTTSQTDASDGAISTGPGEHSNSQPTTSAT